MCLSLSICPIIHFGCACVWCRELETLEERKRHLQNFGKIPGKVCTMSGVALTFEKLRIANVQHGKNCVSSPAAKTTISTDLPKICPCYDRAGLQTVHRPF